MKQDNWQPKSKLMRSRMKMPDGKPVGAECPNCIRLLNWIQDIRYLQKLLKMKPVKGIH